ncbi:MAG: nitrate/nitrite transporter NrtS [Pseudomonadota bacterium]
MGATYFEIPVTDLDRARRFYSDVLGYPSEPEEIDGYAMAVFPNAAGDAANGALACGDVYVPSRQGSLVYFHVPSIDAVLGRVADLGQTPLLHKQEAGAHGYIAEIEDSEGNRIGLHQRPAQVGKEDETAGFAAIALSADVLPRALKVAAVVGTLLFLINYGDRLLGGGFTMTDFLKIGLTYLVPYGVSTWSAVKALRN